MERFMALSTELTILCCFQS